jgi:F-type H+-transporting ATPase subunit delta
MIEKTLAKRYATALLAATNKEGAVEDTEANLLALGEAYRGNARFRAALSSPKVGRPEKKSLLRKVFANGTRSLHEFFDLLVDKRRTNLLPDIAEMYDRLADEFKGLVRVRVRSAWPLPEPQKARLKSDLDRILGKSCTVEAQVDRSLKGGLQIRIGDSVIDGTVANRLKTLREKLHELQKR